MMARSTSPAMGSRRAGHVERAGFAAACSSQPYAAFRSSRRPRRGRRPCRPRRRGGFGPALSALRALLAASPSDTAMAFDLAVVLQWAGRSREATDVFETTRAAEAPEYVLSAMARAYRDQQRWADAGALAAEGGRRFPADPVAARRVDGRGAPPSPPGTIRGAPRLSHAAALAPDDAGIAGSERHPRRLGAPFAAGLHADA